MNAKHEYCKSCGWILTPKSIEAGRCLRVCCVRKKVDRQRTTVLRLARRWYEAEMQRQQNIGDDAMRKAESGASFDLHKSIGKLLALEAMRGH